MFKKIAMSLFAVAFIFGVSKLSFGQTAEKQTKSAAIEVGNKICPVSGEKIDEKTKATYEYQGKIYNFCCPMCIEEFKKDPGKYIKKIAEEKQKESGQKVESPSATMEHHTSSSGSPSGQQGCH